MPQVRILLPGPKRLRFPSHSHWNLTLFPTGGLAELVNCVRLKSGRFGFDSQSPHFSSVSLESECGEMMAHSQKKEKLKHATQLGLASVR